MKRVFIFIVALVIVVYVATSVTGYNYLYKALWFNYVDIDDYKIFPNRKVEKGATMRWKQGASYNALQPDLQLRKTLERLESTALVVVRNDSLLYEEYWDGYGKSSVSNSFSVAKSVVALLTGFALQEKKIKSLDEPIKNYLPEFAEGGKSKITIRHLLTMTSGTDWDEAYSSLFSITTEAYYGKNLRELFTGVNVKDEPGKVWEYKSGDTGLLALVLEKATGKPLSQYASEKLWKPLYAEHPALWSLDRKDGFEKAYCCFNATARDFARIGNLMLNKGAFRGTQLLDKKYVELVLKPVNLPERNGQIVDYYGMQWWVLPDRDGVFYARGILGQYILVVPQKNTVVVRLGKARGEPVNTSHEEVYALVDWILKSY